MVTSLALMHTIKNSVKDFGVNQAYLLEHKPMQAASWSCARVNLPAKVRFDRGWIMRLASKHVLTEKTNFAFYFIKIKV